MPVLVDKESSGGAFPVAVAEYNSRVYVLDAGGSGAVVAFKEDGSGKLHDIPNSTTFLTGTNSGASSISVSPDGHWLVVIEKASNSIDVFPIHPDGTLGTIVATKSVTAGVFATVFTPNGKLIVSENQPGGTDVSSISTYSINPDGSLTAVTQSLRTFGDGNCWNAISPNGKWVYVDNAGTSTVAGFSIASNGALTPIAGTILSTLPNGAANLDMTISADGSTCSIFCRVKALSECFPSTPMGPLTHLEASKGFRKPPVSTALLLFNRNSERWPARASIKSARAILRGRVKKGPLLPLVHIRSSNGFKRNRPGSCEWMEKYRLSLAAF